MSIGAYLAGPSGWFDRVAKRVWRGAVAVSLTGALVVQGCAPVAGVNADDFCSRHRAVMVEEQQRFNDTIAIGALTGAVAGGIIGGLATGDVVGALVGAAAGAIAGGVGGYLTAKQRQHQNRAQILNAINQDVRATRGFVTQLSESVRRLNTCRANEVNNLRRQIQAGQLAGPAARQELAVLRSRIADDRRLVNQVIGQVDENQGAFADALAKTQGVDRDLVVSNRVESYQPPATGYTPGRKIVRLDSPGGETRYANVGLNVREGPGTQYSRIGVFSRGQRVGLIRSVGGGWSEVSTGQDVGYVASRYLAPTPPGPAPAAPAQLAETEKFEPPKVQRTRAPRASSDIEELTIEANSLKAEDAAFEAAVSQELDALEALAA